MGEIVDLMVLFHAISSLLLGLIIFRAAYIKHKSRVWKHWPPALLFTWFIATIIDAAIFSRRFLERSTEWEHVKYENAYSLALNFLGVIASFLLIYRIIAGDTEGEEDRKHHPQNAQEL